MALQGSLETIALPDVLSLLASSAKSGELRVANRRMEGRLWLDDGRLVGWDVGQAGSHVDALFELLRVADGTFAFEQGVDSRVTGEALPVDVVLRDALQRLSEWRTIEAVIPSLDASLALTDEIQSGEITLRPGQWAMLVAIPTQRSVKDLLGELKIGEFEGCRALKEMVDRGLVRVGPPLDPPAPAPIPAAAAVIAPGPVEEGAARLVRRPSADRGDADSARVLRGAVEDLGDPDSARMARRAAEVPGDADSERVLRSGSTSGRAESGRLVRSQLNGRDPSGRIARSGLGSGPAGPGSSRLQRTAPGLGSSPGQGLASSGSGSPGPGSAGQVRPARVGRPLVAGQPVSRVRRTPEPIRSPRPIGGPPPSRLAPAPDGAPQAEPGRSPRPLAGQQLPRTVRAAAVDPVKARAADRPPAPSQVSVTPVSPAPPTEPEHVALPAPVPPVSAPVAATPPPGTQFSGTQPPDQLRGRRARRMAAQAEEAKLAQARAAASVPTTNGHSPEPQPDDELGEEPINRGLLLKFLSSVRT